MSTIFLNFPDQPTFEALLPIDFAYTGETVNPLPDGITALSIIGTVYSGGTYNADGSVAIAPVAQPGWHVNALAPNDTMPAAWQQYVVTPSPSTPVRVFGS